MKKQLQKKPGLTIIEVVMSLAMLMIVMVSVSGLISIVMKNKEFAQQKQIASLLGQEILEEIQLIDELKKDGDGKYYIPLVGVDDLIKEDITEDTLVGTYKGTIKGLDVVFSLEPSLIGNQSSSLSDSETEELEITLTGTNDLIKITYVTDSAEKVIHVLPGEKLNISFVDNKYNIQGNEVTGLPKLTLNFTENYKLTTDLELNLSNLDEAQQLEVQMKRHVKSTGGVKYETPPSGWIKIINNRFDGLEPAGDLYPFNLKISQRNKTLFEIYGNKNFIKLIPKEG
ncbi:MAG: PulJ/GspJ family protein [Turicibacter sp.]